MSDLEQAVLERRSTRLFLRDKPVPCELVTEALELAVHAPSNSNIQPWQLLEQAAVESPAVPVLPESFAHMRRDLDYVDGLGVGVGMFLQTLLLALTARGLGTCVQVSIAGYPETVRNQLGIGEHMRILCGLAIGYPDPEFPANALRVPRNPLFANVTFVDE